MAEPFSAPLSEIRSVERVLSHSFARANSFGPGNNTAHTGDDSGDETDVESKPVNGTGHPHGGMPPRRVLTKALIFAMISFLVLFWAVACLLIGKMVREILGWWRDFD